MNLRHIGGWRWTATKLVGSLSSSALLQIAMLGTGILTARGLSVSSRGQVAAALLVPPLVVQVASLGQPAAMTMFIASGRATSSDAWRAAMRNLRIQGPAALGLGGVATLVVGTSTNSMQLCALAATSIPALLVHHHALAVLQGARRYTAFNVGRLAPAMLYLGLLGGLHVRGLTSLGVAAVWVVAVFGSTILTVGFGSSDIRAAVNDEPPVDLATSIRSFGARSWVSSVSPIETFRLDQLALAIFGSTTALGLYAVGASATNVPRFTADAVTAVGYAEVSAAGLPAGKTKLYRFSLLGLVLCGSAGLTLAILAPLLIPPVFGVEYASAVPVAQLLAVSSVLISVRRIASDGARALGLVGSAAVAELLAVAAIAGSLALGSTESATRMAVAMAIASLIAAATFGLLLRRDLARTRSDTVMAGAHTPTLSAGQDTSP